MYLEAMEIRLPDMGPHDNRLLFYMRRVDSYGGLSLGDGLLLGDGVECPELRWIRRTVNATRVTPPRTRRATLSLGSIL